MTEETTSPAAAATPAEAQHVRASERVKSVPLDWPISFNGRVYDAIVLRRPTVLAVKAWTNAVVAEQAKGVADPDVVFPVFDAPVEVLAALDPDDAAGVEEEARPFLPRRFQAEA